ncbi:B3 domain-containing transcription factor VRN1-like [Humulus lupulus]|uniref:B3 domain-containing transcription factor VRN1-like n=1 Tax=Humulus lupulus TaxID=3486 RepID=UPI002B406EEF|nr:B3 domain-containing transcription factor VRN1-like [Humulus lupulus]
MPSEPPEDSEKPTCFSKNPHFFKIILRDTLEENKLRVPHYFVKKCGETLTETVSVKLPCGSKWEMKLENCNGQFWLQKGWPEFMKHYSIERGHMLTFRYDGNSELYAAIFDKTTVEIDYPSTSAHSDKYDIDEKLQVPKTEVSDDSIEILDDISYCHTSGVKSPCSRSPKRMRTSPTGNVDSPFECEQDQSTTPRKTKYGIPRIMKALHTSEKNAALQWTSDFKSEHPFFKVVMQPYYILGRRLAIPYQFAKIHLNNRFYDVTLKVPNEKKTWPVKYSFGEHKKATPRFETGWLLFAQDNNLKVGDVCVFVMLKAVNVSFEVVILGVGRSSKGSMSPAHYESGSPSFDNCSPAKQVNECNSSQSSEPPMVGKQLSPTFDERVKILENAALESEKPFFKIVIQPSNKWHVCVPLDLADKHIENEGTVILSIPSGSCWSAQFRRRKNYITGKPVAVICSGWKEFMADNDLKLDDVCVFELHNGTEISFHVSIVRVAVSDELKCQGSQVKYDFF